MHIGIEHHDNQFNVTLASKDGAKPFLTIKGCRVVQGSRGPFISWPARKLDSGKYWTHVYASDVFAEHVLKAYDESKPQPAKRQPPPSDDDIPF
jgi:DNA-binding cell septation regulator SpoVG